MGWSLLASLSSRARGPHSSNTRQISLCRQAGTVLLVGERGAGVSVSGFGAPREPVSREGGGRNLSSRVAIGGRRRAAPERPSGDRLRAAVAGC